MTRIFLKQKKKGQINLTYSIFCFYYHFRYGEERYETKELQQRVRQRFAQLENQDMRQGQVPWHVIDAARTIEEVQQDINAIVEQAVRDVQGGKKLQKMWQHHSASEHNKEN